MHDHTAFQQQVVSETLYIAMYSNNGGSSDGYECQFLNYIFLSI